MIVGDNGSGKTTLVKLILGLFEPTAGRLSVGGVEVSGHNRDDYRQLFSAVLTDYHLFEDVMPGQSPTGSEVTGHLQHLGLQGKVAIDGMRFSTLALSTGQRKRMALIHAFVDKRPIAVFDEWTADQDPAFRHLFHAEILPRMKAEGCTIIVISHDERYFDTADRIIHMSGGQIARIADKVPLAGKVTGA
jgi:putative pyoverdin transport system ATP-binding/permease protein